MTSALRGEPLAPAGTPAEYVVSKPATLLARAANAGPSGLPGAPRAADFARFVLGALRIDPGAVILSAPETAATPIGTVSGNPETASEATTAGEARTVDPAGTE